MTELSDAEYLRARYGAPAQDRRTVWIVAVTLGVIALAWLVWQMFAMAQPEARAEAQAMEVVSDSELQVTYNLDAPVGSTVTCTLTALNDAHTEVGVRQITVGPTEAESTAVTATVATIQRASGAIVDQCFFVEP
ncbi:MAG TPA: DUF4307 domain-containing protein [Actinomycetales bacterium]|nr:DUF4307 domain-containing protein [Actinomycetales bacterium]